MKLKIYTKTGDKGKTSLFTGKRVYKNNSRISANGSLDELNSLLGVVLSYLNDEKVKVFMNEVQKDIFTISSILAGAPLEKNRMKKRLFEMEKAIDELDLRLPQIKNFILPEGVRPAAMLFFSRAVARRVERDLVALSLLEEVDDDILAYINRLSDFLFILARYLNFKAEFKESVWKTQVKT